ncbi:hypothetical protein BCON_0020g00620 [Botryotinia convoluta]|uniref:Uncharacterized protein n=1 Tax=Botryotinia convoluta TaxID=54673 RepID=A0A4Z1IL62_9HELO|nr:hypothetical protein BCON_0020g00620 [Botryotinia convoluta]
MTYTVPPRGYMYVIRTNELIEKHLRDLDAKDWTIVQRHEYEREVRQRALKLIDQAVANYPKTLVAEKANSRKEGVPFPYPSPAENARNYLIKNPGVNIRDSIRDYNLPTTRGGRAGGVQNGHGGAHHSSNFVEQVNVTPSDLSTSFPATIQSPIRYQASSSSGGGSMLKPSLAASSQYPTSSRTSKRSIGDVDTMEDKAVVKRERNQ